MKRGQITTITVNGERIRAEYLGKGHFSTGYRVGDLVYLFTKDDPLKEATTHMSGVHVPIVKYVDYTSNRNGDEIEIYTMPYYENITAAHKTAWAIFRILTSLLRDSNTEIIQEQGWLKFNRKRDNYKVFARLVEKAEQDNRIPDSVVDSLDRMYSWAINYGESVGIEMGKRNIGVDNEGNIIFRDVLYDARRLVWLK